MIQSDGGTALSVVNSAPTTSSKPRGCRCRLVVGCYIFGSYPGVNCVSVPSTEEMVLRFPLRNHVLTMDTKTLLVSPVPSPHEFVVSGPAVT